MDQEFSMQKQDFTIIKEKIIKTNELLLVYKEKTETLNKAKNAFKQLKSKYEAAINETNRLKMDNERLNYSLEQLKPKFEQCEKDLIEVRADYKRADERYQQNMIESQLNISKFEEKVKQCTCEKDLSLSPSRKRNSTEKIKELKEKCKEMKDIETNLKNENDHFKLKNKELKMEKLKNVKVLQDFTAKNAILQRDLAAVKNKVQIMELASNAQGNLHLTVSSLKQKHEKEIDSLKMEISKLSLDNQRIKYLELECKNLKEQINRQELQKIKKSDSCVQTEVTLEDDRIRRSDSVNVEKINMLERKCKELEEKIANLKNNDIPKCIGVTRKIIDHKQTLSVCEDDSSDFDDSVSDILSEMILPKALSPLNFSPRTTERPTSPLISLLEPLSPLDEDLSQDQFVPIPNIVITPPTPGVEIAGLSNMVFPVLTENSENAESSKEKINVDKSAVTTTILTKETKKKTNENEQNPKENQPFNNKTLITAKDSKPSVENDVIFKHPGHIEKYGLLECKSSTPIIDKHELLDNAKFSKENKQSLKSITSIATSKGERPSQGNLFQNALLPRETVDSSIHTSLVPTSISTDTESGSLKTQCNSASKISRNLQEESLNMRDTLQIRRKFWLPYNVNSFVKLRKKRRQVKRTQITNNYREMSNQPAQSDTILNALRTLQQNNINFTISNESIPLVQPYNCYSLLTPPKTEPKSITRKVANTFSYSLDCWNKQCTVHNTRMLLRKVQNEEEQLLGFFSVKDEVITPAVSRMAVSDKPNAFNAEDLVSQLLSGIKELVAVKRKKSSGTRRKKRAKSKNRWSDFHSETETELEKLFRTSADVLGRNRRFLAAAKEHSFKSNEESMFESGSDAMVDSGLVTGTPKDDSDSLSCSQNELGKGVVSDVFSSTVRTGENSGPDVVQSNHNENTLAFLKDDENFAGFSSPNAFSCVNKCVDIFSNESPLSSSTTPKFAVCPDMISPIASSKGSPETFQGSSTPFKTRELSHLSRTNSDCFKLPFCPIMISPMTSLNSNPVSQTSKAIQNTYEDSLDSFRTPLAPSLTSFPKASQKNRSEIIDSCIRTDDVSLSRKENDNSANVRLSQISNNVDISKLSNIDLQSLNKGNFPKTKYKGLMQDWHDNKPSSSGNKMSSICQSITFDSVTDNEHLDPAVDLVSMDVENIQQSVSKSLLTCVDDNQKSFDISKDDNVLCVNSTIQGNENNNIAEAATSLQSEVKDNKLKLDESSFHIDLSLKSSELNFTLDNISISQLEVSCAKNNDLDKPNEMRVNACHLKERHHPDTKETCNLVKNSDPIETANFSCPERRDSLREKSQCNVNKDKGLELKFQNNDLTAIECPVEHISPRTRAAKRKLEDEVKNPIVRTPRLSKSAKHEEIISKDVLGADSENAGDISSKHEELVGPLIKKRGRPRKVDKLSVLENKTNSDAHANLSAEIPGQQVAKSEIIPKEENSHVNKMISKDVLGADSENGGDISTKHEELVAPLIKKRGRPRKVDKLSVLKNKTNSDSRINLPAEIPSQQVAISEIITTKEDGNVEETISNNVLGTDSENAVDIATNCTDSENASDILTNHEELVDPVIKKRGRPRKVYKLTVLENKTNSDSQVNLPAKIPGQQVAKSEIISKEENGHVEEILSNNVLDTDSENASDISTRHEELVGPLVKKRGRPRKVDKLAVLQNKNNSNSWVNSPTEIPGQQDVKSDINQKEANGNVEEMICKKVLGTDSENTGDLSKNSCITLTDEDSVKMCETKDKEQQHKIKRSLKNRRRKSANLNQDMSVDLFDWELDPATDRNFKKEIDNCEQTPLEQLRKNIKRSATEAVSTDGLDSGKETEFLKGKRTSTTRKIISNEFIVESESDSDNPSKVHSETVHQVNTRIQKGVSDSEQGQSSSNSISSIIKTNNNKILVENLSTSKKSTETAFDNAEDKIRKIEMPLRSDSETKSNRISNYPLKTAITLEIQDILRNLSNKASQSSNLLHTTTVSSAARDLFGDSSGSEDETNKKDLKIIANPKPKKRPAKQNLKRKMLNQVKGLIYATGNYKDCNIVKKNVEDKPEEIPSRSNVSEEINPKSLPIKEKEVKKIKIVQNILISKGRAFNLLSSSSTKVDQPDSAVLTPNATEPIRPSPNVNQGESSRPYQRKKIKLEQNISSTSSTPVDILSQVMQGMVKTGPKTARKNAFNQTRYLASAQSSRSSLNNVRLRTSGAQKKIVHENVGQPCRIEKPVTEKNTAAIVRSVDDRLDCPRSPDVMEVPDRVPRLIPTEQPVKIKESKVRALIDKLMVFSNEAKMLDDVIQEFAFQDMTFMVEIILDKLSLDYRDKADNSFPPSPPMTSTQRILLGFLLKLDRSTHPGIEDRFLRLAEQQLFNKYSVKLEIIDPITRLYTALCKLRYDLNRIRRFICEGFYFMGDLAIPMFFTLLTMWGEVLPMMESERSDDLLSKVIVQICYLKDCNQPGYNLMPLRDLLKKYYGYPTERWKCEDFFKEIMVEYIRNPSIRLSDFTVLLFLKNKPTKWVYQQVKETIIPLYSQARDSNPNLKATLVILLANICCAFNQYEKYDWSVILEMDRWFIELDKDDIDPILKRSIHLARGRLPRKVRIRNRNKTAGNGNTGVNKTDKQDNLAETTENCPNNLPLEETIQDCEDSRITDISRVAMCLKEENSESTKNSENTDLRLEHSSQSKGADNIENADNSFSNEKENAVQSSSSDIEF